MTTATVPHWRREQLAYCSNVHPGESLEDVIRVVTEHVAAVRAARRLERMAAGLWLGAACVDQLSRSAGDIAALRAALDDAGIDVCTLNGFPYGNFHADTVKSDVYRPDWSEPSRFAYTLKLAELLAELLPDEQRTGTISTLPLGYAANWSDERQGLALASLCWLAHGLRDLEEKTGRRIVVCLEMEPGCVLEKTTQVLRLFRTLLPETATGMSVAEDSLRRYLGVCLDVCHQAVMFEDPAAALRRIHNAGILVGKIQVSNALEVARPAAKWLREALRKFDEPVWLHQVGARDAGGRLYHAPDLGAALGDADFPCEAIWRVHFHVPVQARELTAVPLRTTQRLLGGVLDVLLKKDDLRPQLEVETYTWQQLPGELRPRDDAALHRGLAGELAWLEGELDARGLLREAMS
jgi:sugar phosphate isomerase/epimerase